MFLLLCASSAFRPASSQNPTPPPSSPEASGDPELHRSLRGIERGIGQRDLARLAEMLPYDERVLVRWDRPLQREGLLTGRQVLLLFGELFRGYRTERFALQPGSLKAAGGVYHCMGRWTLRSPGGQSEAIELHFSLRYDGGVWAIREVRQTR